MGNTMNSLLQKISGGFVAVLLVMTNSVCLADEPGTRQQAQAMVERAAAFLKENGREKALAEFDNPKGQFIDRDLYVVTYAAADGVRLSHPYNRKLIGRSVAATTDIDGKTYGQEILTVANTKGSGWVEYKYTDPTTKKLSDKELYILKVGDIILGCGAYKQIVNNPWWKPQSH